MDEIITQFGKFLSNSVFVKISSNPPFAIEIFLSAVICVVHVLLLYELTTLVKRTNGRAAERLRARVMPFVPIKDINGGQCSIHSSIVALQTSHYQKTTGSASEGGDVPRPPVFCFPFKRMNKISATSGFKCRAQNNYTDRVERLLSLSPSEYVRRDKERQNTEAGLKTCIQSLTSLLEQALTSDSINKMSKSDIRKSIQTIRDNFEYHLSNTYGIQEFPSPSLQSLIVKSTAKNALTSSLSPDLVQTVFYTSKNLKLTSSEYKTTRQKRNKDDHGDSTENFGINRSESLSEIINKDITIIDQDRKNSK